MQLTVSTVLALLLIGLAAGSLSGLVGIGGGIIIVPALAVGFGLSQHTAQGTSLAVLAMPVVAWGAWNYYQKGHVNVPFALLIAAGFIVGGRLGGWLANELPAATIQKIFAGLLIVVGVKLMFFGK
jgi:uncharacterized protein